MFEIKEDEEMTNTEGAKIRVVGVGGGGCNAVNTMIQAGLKGVEYIVANTDAQALSANHAPIKIQLGREITKGLGAGANPEVGRKAALDEYEKLSEVLDGADMVFITAGMGGGTGTGAAPVIAKLAKELGALTVGVVTKPFIFEGKKRFRQAEMGITTLEENVDSLITIPNQRLLYLAGESLSLVDTFKKADEVLLNAVRGISDLINNTGHINADFADVSTVMANKGLALMGAGLHAGPDRAIKAATEAISSPLLEDITIDGATGIIINITGNESLTMHETNEAVTLIMEAADEEAEIIFGTVIDDSLEDNVKVTVIATGLGGQERVTTKSVRNEVRKPEVSKETAGNEGVQIRSGYSNNIEASEENNSTEVTATNSNEEVNEESWSEPAHESEETYKRATPTFSKESESSGSSLVSSIKEAATQYSQTKTEPTREWTGESKPTNNRAKSIAEKLGFINFDEEELDTPTYLRKDEKSEKSNSHRESTSRHQEL